MIENRIRECIINDITLKKTSYKTFYLNKKARDDKRWKHVQCYFLAMSTQIFLQKLFYANA